MTAIQAMNPVAYNDLIVRQINREREYMLQRMTLPKGIPDDKRSEAAHILAYARVCFDLEPQTGEVTLGHFGDHHFKLIIQYNGWKKIARRRAEEMGTQIYWPPATRMSDEELVRQGGNVCYRCQGKGKRKGKGKGRREEDCVPCQGKGEFPPERCVGMIQKFGILSEAEAAFKMGMDYHPHVGIGIWQPGMAVPVSKTKEWKATATAARDAVRQSGFSVANQSIPGLPDHNVQITGEDEETAFEVIDPVKEELMVAEAGQELVEDIELFLEKVVRPSIKSNLFSSPGEILEAMKKGGLSFSLPFEGQEEVVFKHRLKGVVDRIYPLAWDKQGPLSPNEYTLLKFELRDLGYTGDVTALWLKLYEEPFISPVNRTMAHNMLVYVEKNPLMVDPTDRMKKAIQDHGTKLWDGSLEVEAKDG